VVIALSAVVSAAFGLIGLDAAPRSLAWPQLSEDFLLGAGCGLVIGVVGGAVAVVASGDIPNRIGRWLFVGIVVCITAGAALWAMSSFPSYVGAA